MLVVLLVTYPCDKDFVEWCKSLVERRLAACINIIDVKSVYLWENKTNIEDEVLLFIKTSRERAQELKKVIEAEHPYKVPEVVELSPVDVNKPYLEWVLDSVRV